MHCANPNCSAESRYFRGGSLHCIDCGEAAGEQFRGARRRLIWFCPDCAVHWAVENLETGGPADALLFQSFAPRRSTH
jgi:hypothetical protein